MVRGGTLAWTGAVPRLIDRQANAELVHPIVMRILADEGPHAVTYRRIVAESDLTLSAVRNMWQTQEKLVQRGAAHARSFLPCRMFLPALTADLDLVVREGVRRLLPLSVEQRLAHRALASLRWAPAESAGRAVLTEYDDLRRLRVLELAADVAWLRLPEPRPGRGHTSEDLRARQRAEPEGGALVLHGLVRGLAHLLAQPESPLSAAHAEACLLRIDASLLD